MTYDSNISTTDSFLSSYDLAPVGGTLEESFNSASVSVVSADEVASLRRQASQLEHLLKVMPAGVIVLDGKGVVKQANDQAKALLGEPLEEQVWRNIIARSFKPRADDGHEYPWWMGVV